MSRQKHDPGNRKRRAAQLRAEARAGHVTPHALACDLVRRGLASSTILDSRRSVLSVLGSGSTAQSNQSLSRFFHTAGGALDGPLRQLRPPSTTSLPAIEKTPGQR